MKGKIIAFLIPVVYVFALLLVVSPSGVSAFVKPDDGEWRDSSSCVATACGSSIGEKEQTYFDKIKSERCETRTFTYLNYALGSWANCPAGYEVSDKDEDKCVKKEMRYADYKGNPRDKNCPEKKEKDYKSNDSRKPCSMLVVVDTKDRVWVPKTVTVDVEYGLKSHDRNKCHRPTAESLDIPSYARHSYYTTLPEFIRDSIVEYSFVETETTRTVSCENAEIIACPEAGVCPTNCGYEGGEVADGEGGYKVCPAIAACPAEGTCPTNCDYEGGEVADGKGGYKVCPATEACPVDTDVDEGEVQGVTDEAEVKGTTDVVLADTGASDSTLVYLVEGILVLGTLVSSAMLTKKYAI